MRQNLQAWHQPRHQQRWRVLNEQAGLAFDFAMIEMARSHPGPLLGVERTIVPPRIIAKTELIQRFVIRNEATGVVAENIADTS